MRIPIKFLNENNYIHKRKIRREKYPIQGITNGSIRRLARRGGVKRISGFIYDDARIILKKFVQQIIQDSISLSEYSKRKTVTAMDIIYSLRKLGKNIYGYEK